MKILYPIYLQLPSPLARSVQIVNTCYHLALQGVAVDLLCANRCDIKEIQEFYGLGDIPANFKIIGLPALIKTPTSKLRFSSRLPWDFFLKRYIKKIINNSESPIIYLRELKTAKAVLPILKQYQLKSVYEAHHIEYRVSDANLLSLETKLYNEVSKVICITKQLLTEMRTIFVDANIGPALPNGCNPVDLSALSVSREYLFYAGQLYRWKGVDTIIKMMKFLPEQKLLIVGGSSQEDVQRCKKLASAENVLSQIDFIGQVPPSQVAFYGAKAKIMLLPNGDELYNSSYTSPIKLFEYLSYAKPIVASDLPTISDITASTKSALLAKPDNPQSFADAVQHILNSPDLSNKLSKNALALSKAYTWEHRATELKKCFKHILSN